MIGSGLLLVPYHFKTLGIFISIGSSILFNLITFISSYFLLRCKDVTQRYSYAVYSRMALGYIGTVSCKFAILIKSISLCCVYLKMLGNIIRTFLLIFFPTYSDKFFLDAKFLLLIFAVLTAGLTMGISVLILWIYLVNVKGADLTPAFSQNVCTICACSP